jgi:hypothetical protein
MKTFRLVVDQGNLCFPHGGFFEHDGQTLWDDPSTPSLLIYRYAAGDVDTFAWPLVGSFAEVQKKRIRLASALYAERECNPCFPPDALIELPDGEPFDFDQLLADAEKQRRKVWADAYFDARACGLSEDEANEHARSKLETLGA